MNDNNDTDEYDSSKYEKHEQQRKRKAHRCLLGVVGSCALIVLVTFVARRTRNNHRNLQQQQQELLRKFYRKQQKQQLQLKGVDIESSSSDSQESDSNNDEIMTKLSKELQQLNHDILSNTAGGIRWIQPHLLPNIPGDAPNPLLLKQRERTQKYKQIKVNGESPFVAKRRHVTFEWENEYNELSEEQKNHPTPKVDYTKHAYDYPALQHAPPSMGGYPKLQTLGDILTNWPQDELDTPPTIIKETLFHFNYSDPSERDIALKFRDAELPFKLYDVPEVTAAGKKWTDDNYLASHFDSSFFSTTLLSNTMPLSDGQCQESPNNYFAFYTPQVWNISDMGLPPVRNNDMTFQKWSQHARYADAVSLSPEKPHFYWQAGVPKEERFQPKQKWTFVSRDLPSFSSPGETFFQFHISEQKGIQCRFGERGVTAATHYDGGRNMIAMVTGAKRYILSPPRECSKLGITTNRGNAIFRHSLLNFGHLQYLDNKQGDDMSSQERAWLERARNSEAVDTVLKAGEVLYLPSHWFHYIISLQKSAQCNVRSGINQVGTREFGGIEDVKTCGEDKSS